MKKILTIALSVILAATVLISVPSAAAPFTDVKDTAWYRKAVNYVYDNGLMVGTDATSFSPNVTMSRAMLVMVLYKMAGSPTADTDNPFSDVEAGKWYTPAVLWAYRAGVTAGTPEGKFLPNANVTRQDAACLIIRFVNLQGKQLENNPVLKTPFADMSTVSAYAEAAVEAMRTSGLAAGDEKGNYHPKNNLTRAEAAVLLMNLHKLISQTTDPTEPTETETDVTEPTEPETDVTEVTEPTEPPAPDWITVGSGAQDADGWLAMIP